MPPIKPAFWMGHLQKVTSKFFHLTLCLIMLVVFILFLNGCAVTRDATMRRLSPDRLEETIERHHFSVPATDNVIGRIAAIRLEDGDTLPDLARHFGLGLNAVSAANPEIDVWVPAAGQRILLPLSFILPDTPRKGIAINLAAMRLFYFKKAGASLTVSTYPVGIGTKEQPTPMGHMYVKRKKFRPIWHVPASIAKEHRQKGDPLPANVPPGPLNPLGAYALYLSKSGYLVHGTNKPASIGLRATHGCVRLYPEDIKHLFENTPVKTPVTVVNQPYLVGQRDGIVYLEVHTPPAKAHAAQLKRAYAKLKKIEQASGQVLDWEKIAAIMAEARGFPVSVSVSQSGNELEPLGIIKLKHPDRLYGQPEVPELRTDAWYVLAATLSDSIEALRLAAIINHQGPQIPARVLSKKKKHRVLAGPFDSKSEARDVVRRLKVDLELDGLLVEP